MRSWPGFSREFCGAISSDSRTQDFPSQNSKWLFTMRSNPLLSEPQLAVDSWTRIACDKQRDVTLIIRHWLDQKKTLILFSLTVFIFLPNLVPRAFSPKTKGKALGTRLIFTKINSTYLKFPQIHFTELQWRAIASPKERSVDRKPRLCLD